jgi:hypothetical protein
VKDISEVNSHFHIKNDQEERKISY